MVTLTGVFVALILLVLILVGVVAWLWLRAMDLAADVALLERKVQRLEEAGRTDPALQVLGRRRAEGRQR